MSVTTTAHFNWSVENPSGNVSYTIKYRYTGTSIWTQYSTSGTTAAISGLTVNRIYDFAIVNVNNDDNPQSAISQGINITDPGPAISPINTAVSYSFSNLSVDMTSYSTTIALQSSPGNIIATHTLSPATVVTDTFSGLTALTSYILTITPVAGIFYKTFSYIFTTEEFANCPAPLSVNATLV